MAVEAEDQKGSNPIWDKHKFEVVIGIDFGTYGSGYSFALVNGDRQIHSDQQWTESGDHLDIKTRTSILLDKMGKFIAFGNDAERKYHSDGAYKDSLYFERFKMALYEGADAEAGKGTANIVKKLVPFHQDNDSGAQGQDGVDSIIVLTEALRFMKEHTMGQVASKLGITRLEDIQWVVSVPAIWSNAAKQMMMKAAKRAEMTLSHVQDHVIVAYEPDCAAADVRADLAFAENEKYMILDLGGGTADVACHQAVGDNEAIEIWHPTGGPWGSTYVDDAFIRLFKGMFSEPMVNKLIKEEPTEWSKLLQNFRQAKHNFDPESEATAHPLELPAELLFFLEDECDEQKLAPPEDIAADYVVPGLAGEQLVTITNGRMAMKRAVWVHLFDTVVQPIVAHCERLLQEPVLQDTKYMCLVGGLSECSYVRTTLQDKFPDVKVYTPHRPVLSVVRGATRFGLNPYFVRSYVSALSYGVGHSPHAQVTDPKYRLFKDSAGKPRCFGKFDVFVRVGDSLPVDHRVVKEYRAINQEQTHISLKIYSSQRKDPKFVPIDFAADVGEEWAEHDDGKESKREGEVKVKLPDDWVRAKDKMSLTFQFGGTRVTCIGKNRLETREIEIDFLKDDP